MANSSEKKEKTEKLGFKRLIHIVAWTFKLYFRISPVRTTCLLLVSILTELRGLFYTLIFAKIIDEIISVVQKGPANMSDLYPYMYILLGYMLFFEGFLNTVYTYMRRSLNQTFRFKIDRFMYQHLNSLGVQTLENPDIINLTKRADEWLYTTLDVLYEAISFVADMVVVVVAALIIFKFLPVFTIVLFAYTILNFIPENYFAKKDFRWQTDNTEGKRKTRMSSFVLTNPNDLQEININNGFNFFDNKYTEFTSWYVGGLLNIIKNSQSTRFGMATVGKFITIYGYIKIITNAITGVISVGSIIFYIRSLDYFSSSLGSLMSSATYLNEYAIKINDVVKVFELKPMYEDGTKELGKLTVAPEIEFRNVSFKYFGSDKYVYENLNLKIKSGEKVAIVGHNGAGKTTLVKLLAKIYPVTEGQILINGIDIKEIKTSEWYKNLAVLFQEFNFYGHLTAKENIYIGNPSEPINEKAIIEAAKNADAHEFIAEYKNGYDQLLSEKYKGGIRPSTGQMQKIAIAKFFYRNAPVAIFDEPTAAIDAVSEYKIFNKIYSFFEKKSVVIISHRFSTVRNADRIIVIEKGKVIEEGSHEELVDLKGSYWHAFNLQASGYQEKAS